MTALAITTFNIKTRWLRLIIVLTIMMSSSVCFGQLDEAASKLWKGYQSQTWSAFDVNNLVDMINYHPYLKKELEGKLLKTFFLQSSPQILRQLNDESSYLCAGKHDEYFEIWNMYHPKIDKAFWNRYCKGLIILMRVDGMAKVE